MAQNIQVYEKQHLQLRITRERGLAKTKNCKTMEHKYRTFCFGFDKGYET